MKIPTAKADILKFATEEIAPQCLASQKDRINQYAVWRSYIAAGTEDTSRPSLYNRCGPHIERYSAFLFSPEDVRFLVEFARGVGPEWHDRSTAISELLSEEFHGSGADMTFGDGVPWALGYGMTAVKMLWTARGIETFLVMPYELGVWREDVQGFDRQQAITHVSFVTKSELARRVKDHPQRAAIIEGAGQQIISRTAEDENSLLHQLIIGGQDQVGGVNPTGGTARGTVRVFNTAPAAHLSAETLQDIVQITECWVVDDETQDWTTIQYVEPGILIEPTVQKRNIHHPGRQPFNLIQPNPWPKYFWGRSELSDLWRMQDVITTRLDDIEHITHLRAHPPRAFIGFSGISDDSKDAMGAPDGVLVEPSPAAKIENLAPEMPQDAYANLEKTTQFFDDLAGFTPLMQGQGEAGVRSGIQSTTLSRAAGARMRRAALRTERQCAEYGDEFLELMIAKYEGALARGEPGKEWMLAQMPDERSVKVDAHSSSPAFAMDNNNLAFGLARSGAVTPEGLLYLTHPPMMNLLLKMLAKKQAAEAQFAKEHPEIVAKQAGKKRR